MSYLAARRTAILSAIAAFLASILQSVQGNEGRTWVEILIAVGAGIAAYIAAYQVIGLTEKILMAGAATIVASVVTGIEAGRSSAEIALTTGIVVIGILGTLSALPSTQGSATETTFRDIYPVS